MADFEQFCISSHDLFCLVAIRIFLGFSKPFRLFAAVVVGNIPKPQVESMSVDAFQSLKQKHKQLQSKTVT